MLNCPRCSTTICKGEEGYYCPSCSFTAPFVYRGKRLSEPLLHQLFSQGETVEESWKRRDTGALFLGKLKLTSHYAISFVPSFLPSCHCPLCQSKILKTPIGWQCEKGDVTVWEKIAERKLLLSEVKQLFLYGITDELSGFVSKETGKRFSAKLKIEQDGSVGFVFE